MEILRYVLVAGMGYLVGSFPTGYLIARLWKGIDPRQHGSGRTGGTNILRAAGKGPAFFTIVGDFAKGALAVLLARMLVGTSSAAVVAGLAAVLGHNRSIFLRFRGGAGSMTNAGVVFVLAPHVLPFMAVAGVVAAFLSRMASVTSIVAAVTMLVALVVSFWLSLSPAIYVLYGVLACALILFELRPNIQRLCKGSERRVEHY
ncbi:MAG: glycerol-3-phosphate 1-O-acyltransferase PlsY [Anaerolineae bacterium]